MVGDMILIGSVEEIIISEQVITVYCEETKEQQAARVKAGLPLPFFQYTAVKSRGKRPWE